LYTGKCWHGRTAERALQQGGYGDYTRKKNRRVRETVKKFFKATKSEQANNGGRYRKFMSVVKALPFTPQNMQFILKIH
jgi:hypothetical protein